jgi:putative transposase
MPQGLERYYGAGDLRLRPLDSARGLGSGLGRPLVASTCSCYQRKPWLDTAPRRDLFLQILEEVRKQHRFVVLGYVVMPEHFHLLVTEPQVGDPSTAMQSVKQRYAQRVVPRRRWRDPGQQSSMPIWQPRFYDFNVWTEHKRIEKLRYMHRNPVKRGLVEAPEQWLWSSFRYYKYGEAGLVRINDCDIMRMSVREPA